MLIMKSNVNSTQAKWVIMGVPTSSNSFVF